MTIYRRISRYMDEKKTALKVGIAALAIGAISVGIYRNMNYSRVGFQKVADSGSVSTDVGSGFFEVSRQEPFRLNYAAEDWNGLEQLVVYDNGTELLRTDIAATQGHCGMMMLESDVPGLHEYRLIARDKGGNERQSTSKVMVHDKLYDGEKPSIGLDISYSW